MLINNFAHLYFYENNKSKGEVDRKKRRGDWEGVGDTERKKTLFMFILSICYKIAAQVWMKLLGPHLVQPSPPASSRERREMSLALRLMLQSGPSVLTHWQDKMIHLGTRLSPFLSARGFYCGLFRTTILLFSPSAIKLDDCLRSRHSQRQQPWEECAAPGKRFPSNQNYSKALMALV